MNVRTNTAQVVSARGRRAAVAGALLTGVLAAAPAHSGPNEQARRIYERLAGEPPSAAVLAQMANIINTGCGGSCQPSDPNLVAAAAVATDPVKYPNSYAHSFYNVVVKNMVIPWTNRDQTVFAPFNDYAATVIGMVRDDVAFNTALSADILYTVNGVSPAPSLGDNNHYATAEANGIDLSMALKQTTQSGTYGIPTAATAGLITTRGATSSFFINGTNRAMFRYTMMNHFCNDMQTLMDTTRPTDRVRQDVARSPGGDSRVFLNTCAGCHSGMDPMAQAFAYYNFNGTAVGDGTNTGTLVYTAGQVQPKYLINANNFIYGFVTPDDSWSNRWRGGVNASLGWDTTAGPGYGNGAKSLGVELESSDAFAQCQVVKVFTAVCFRAPNSSTDMTTVQTIKTNFKSGGYKLKQVFQQAAAACPGQ